MEQHFKDLKGRTIALWGLAFKPRTDDMREAPAIPIIEGLLARGASVRAYDPEAAPAAPRLFDDRIALCEKSYDALTGADALAVVTEWNEFREPDFKKMRQLLKRRSCSTAATSTRPSTCARSASPTSPLAAERAPVLVTGGAGYIGSHASKALRARRLPRRRLRQPDRRPSRGRALRRAGRGRHRRRRCRAPGAAPARRLRRDALCGVPRRRRVGARAGRVLPQQRRAAR